MGFVLLSLLDGALVQVHIRQRGVALNLLGDQVPVRHGVTDDGDLTPLGPQDGHNPTGCLALAATGTNGADRDDRLRAFDHGGVGTHQHKVGACGVHQSGLAHQDRIGDIGVGKDNLFDLVILDEGDEFRFGMDGDPVRVELPGQLLRVDPTFDVGNLSGGEGHDLVGFVVPKERVKVVKVSSGGTHDEYFSRHN